LYIYVSVTGYILPFSVRYDAVLVKASDLLLSVVQLPANYLSQLQVQENHKHPSAWAVWRRRRRGNSGSDK